MIVAVVIVIWFVVMVLAAKLFGALCGFNDRTPRQ